MTAKCVAGRMQGTLLLFAIPMIWTFISFKWQQFEDWAFDLPLICQLYKNHSYTVFWIFLIYSVQFSGPFEGKEECYRYLYSYSHVWHIYTVPSTHGCCESVALMGTFHGRSVFRGLVWINLFLSFHYLLIRPLSIGYYLYSINHVKWEGGLEWECPWKKYSFLKIWS